MIHVYGIVDQLRELPPLAGVDDAPLERRRVRGLELIVSRTSQQDSDPVSRDSVLRHAQVVEELMGVSASVLPAQYGHAFGDDAELAAAVEPKAGDLARGLDRVRGCVELGLRIAAPAAHDPPTASSGAGYMRARLAEEKRRARLVEELHEPLARLARASTVSKQRTSGALEASYLVRAEDTGRFRDEVLRLENAHSELSVVCTGPWPPYSFAGAEES